MNIQDSAALVVGGASGLGAATARRLAAAGAVLTIADRDGEQGAALATELGARFVACDVCDQEAVAAAVDAAADAEGGLRIAVTCAGIGAAAKTANSHGPHALDAFERVIAVNLVGSFNVVRLAAAAMMGNEPDEGDERGVLLTTASIAAFDGQIGQVAYAASKAGVVGMTLPVARDLADYGIRINTIAPGLFDTPLLASLPEEARTSLGATIPFPPRLGDPAEFAQLAEQLISNTMMNGETVRIDGALRMAPR